MTAGLATAAPQKALAAVVPAADRPSEANAPQPGSNPMSNQLSTTVQMQFMRPTQLEVAARRFPVVYVPFGLIEWHGRHLPLGNDALKAHAILVKCAEQVGGVVYPRVYFHDGFDQTHLVPVLTDLFQRLKKTGFRVTMILRAIILLQHFDRDLGHAAQGLVKKPPAAGDHEFLTGIVHRPLVEHAAPHTIGKLTLDRLAGSVRVGSDPKNCRSRH